MTLPDNVRLIVARFAQKYPVPTNGEVAAQAWTHDLCRQLAFSFPGQGWGHKSASPTRPHSKDCIALKTAQAFLGWDVVLNAGTAAAKLDLAAQSQDLTGQEPEPVPAFDFLADTPEPEPQPEPKPDPAPCPCEAKLNEILGELRLQRMAVEQAGLDMVKAIKDGIRVRF